MARFSVHKIMEIARDDMARFNNKNRKRNEDKG